MFLTLSLSSVVQLHESISEDHHHYLVFDLWALFICSCTCTTIVHVGQLVPIKMPHACVKRWGGRPWNQKLCRRGCFACEGREGLVFLNMIEFDQLSLFRVTGGELFDEIVAREYYSETDARYVHIPLLTLWKETVWIAWIVVWGHVTESREQQIYHLRMLHYYSLLGVLYMCYNVCWHNSKPMSTFAWHHLV